MTVRLPEEIDRALEAIARSRSMSKNAVLIEAADRFIRQESKTDRVLAAIDDIGIEYATAIERLEDA